MINQLQQPLVSIIIPCYNYAHFLLECFDNLKQQSYTNWECLIIDNVSSDNTKQVVEEALKSDNRIKYFYQPIKGPSAARNMGIKASKGSFIQLLDADDLIRENKLKNGIALFDAIPDTDIVYSDMRYFSNENNKQLFFSMKLNPTHDKPWMCYVEGKKEKMLPELLKENIMVISSPLIKKSSLTEIGYFDESLVYNEDWELWLRFAFADKKFVFDKVEDSQTLIRVHKTSHSSNNAFKMFLAGIRIGLKYEPLIEILELRNKFNHKTIYAIYSLEKIIYSKRNDFLFLKDSLPLLINVLPYKKYKSWLDSIDSQKYNMFKFSVTLNYIYGYLKYKLKNV